MPSLRRALGYTLTSQYLSLGIALASTAIIARLLTPDTIGTFSTAAVLLAVAHMLRNFGASEYLIQQKELTRAKIRAALGTSFLMSWSLAGLLVLASGSIASWFRTPELAGILRILSLNFVLVPFGAMVMAQFRRDMAFDKTMAVNVPSGAVEALVSIALAFLGFGAAGLAWGGVAGMVATVVIADRMRPRGFPRLPALVGIGEVFRFGFYTSGASAAQTLGNYAPDIIIGKLLGMSAVGYYSKAAAVASLFNQLVLRAVNLVMLSDFAERYRSGEHLGTYYAKVTGVIVTVAWSTLAFVGVHAAVLVNVLFGDQWGESIPLVQWLCVANAIQFATPLWTRPLVAMGLVRVYMRVQMLVQFVMVACVAVAAAFGLVWVAFGVVVGALLGYGLIMKTMRGSLEMSAKAWGLMYVAPAGIGLVVLVSAWAPRSIFPELDPNSLPFFAASLVTAGCGFVAAVGFSNSPLKEEAILIYRRLKAVRMRSVP